MLLAKTSPVAGLNPKDREMLNAAARALWISALAIASGCVLIAPSSAQSPDACKAAIQEFGLEGSALAEDIIKRCEDTAKRDRRRGAGDKSTEPTDEDLDPAIRVDQAYSRKRRKPRAIYRTDDRHEAEEVPSITEPVDKNLLMKAVRATAIITPKNNLSPPATDGSHKIGLETYKVYDGLFQKKVPLCNGEKFYSQKTGGYCTAFLVSPDVVATAGHCVNYEDVDAQDVSQNKFSVVFGFELRNGLPRSQFSPDEVYDVINIRGLSKPGHDNRHADFALLQLDRPVPASIAVPLRLAGPAGQFLRPGETRLALIGHPSGLPKKVSLHKESRIIEAPDAIRFRAQLNAFKGNSGSPVVLFDQPDVVAGILVNGQNDFIPDVDLGCLRHQVFQPDEVCRDGRRCAETVTRSELLEPYLP